MTKYELLIDKAYNSGVNVYELDLGVETPCGKCIGDSLIVNKNINERQKYCILAEEFGHFETTSGNILAQANSSETKQELKARKWGYDEIIGLDGLISSYKAGCRSNSEIADFLDISDEYLVDALEFYKNKYGISQDIDDYTIFFSPCFNIVYNG